jgi:trimeric autotransporter adhesin
MKKLSLPKSWKNTILLFSLMFTYVYTLPNASATTAPTILSPLNNAYLSTDKPTITWNEIPGATNYEIEVALDAQFINSYGDNTGTDEFYTTPSAISDGKYYIRVRAYSLSGGGWSDWSATRSITIDTQAPASLPSPDYPSANGYTNDTTPRLNWASQSAIDFYQIQFDDNNDLSSLLIDTTTEESYYNVMSPLSEIDYYWRIRAQDLAGHLGDWSPIWRFTVDTTTPGTPTLISPIFGWYFGTVDVDLNWTDVIDCD